MQTSNVPGFGFYAGATAVLMAGAALLSVTVPTKQAGTPKLEVVEVVEQTTYTGGAIAYVDTSVDPQGECVLTWSPDHGGRFASCEATEWQRFYHHKVGPMVQPEDIKLHWDENFAPDTWR